MMVYVDGGEEYEAKETLIDEVMFRLLRKAFAEGADFISLPDRIIKRSRIKEILPADEIVQEYLGMGMSIKALGTKEGNPALLSGNERDALSGNTSEFSKKLNMKMGA